MPIPAWHAFCSPFGRIPNKASGMREQERRIRETARAIEQYLLQHPRAADSLEGIAGWWLARQRIENELEVVRAALLRLADEGVIVEVDAGRAAGPIYRLRRGDRATEG